MAGISGMSTQNLVYHILAARLSLANARGVEGKGRPAYIVISSHLPLLA